MKRLTDSDKNEILKDCIATGDPDLPGAVALLMERLEDPLFRKAYADEFGVSLEVTKQGIRATLTRPENGFFEK